MIFDDVESLNPDEQLEALEKMKKEEKDK